MQRRYISPTHGKVQNIISYQRTTNSGHDNTPTRNTKWTRLTIANDGKQLRSGWEYRTGGNTE